MNQERLELIKSKLTDLKTEFSEVNGTPAVITDSKTVINLCIILKSDSDISFDLVIDVFGVDNFQKQNRFEVVCSLYSTKFKDRIFVKIPLDSKNPEMPSLTAVWKGANWYEREAYDMFGIKFSGHPNLKRILMGDDWVGYPQRKDFPLTYETPAFNFNKDQIETGKAAPWRGDDGI